MKTNSAIDIIKEWLQQALAYILGWFEPLLADLEQRLIPVTEQIKPIWDDPIWQALIVIFLVLLVIVIFLGVVKWGASTGIQLLQSLWSLLNKLFDILRSPIKPIFEFVQGWEHKRKLKSLRNTALRSRMQRVVDGIKYITTRREWRYKTAWFLLLGEEKANKSALLRGIRNGRHASLIAKEKDLKAAGSQWHFFDGGVLIDVAHQNGQASTEVEAQHSVQQHYLKRLNKVIGLVHRHRPEKPIDAIILTVSAASLLTAKTTTERTALGEKLFQQLWLAQKKTGFIIPTYLIVTQCDVISGFDAFWQVQPQERLDEMVGWSNPLRLEIDFDPDWVDQAFKSVVENLRKAQLNIAASSRDIADTDNFLLFHQYFNRLCAPLRAVTETIFSRNKVQTSIPLRGIYFTGSVHEKQAFTDHLFNRKIFAEQNLATPIEKTLLSTEQTLRKFQLGTLFLGVIAFLWLAADTWRMYDYNSNLTRVLGHIENESRIVQPGCDPLGFNEYRLLSGLSEVGNNPIFLSMPASLGDFQFDENSNMVATHLLAPKLFSKFDCRLQEKSKELQDFATKALNNSAVKDSDSPIEMEPDFQAFTEEVAKFESRYADFLYLIGPLGTDKEVARKLKGQLDYLYDSPTPAAAVHSKKLVTKAIQFMKYEVKKVSTFRGDILKFISVHSELLMDSMHQEAFDAPSIQEGDYSDTPLLTQLSQLEDWLTQMNNDWTKPYSESPCGTVSRQLAEPISVLRNSNNYDEQDLDTVLEHFNENNCYQTVRSALTKTNVLQFGPAFNLDDDLLTLQPQLVALIPQINGLERLPFMQPNSDLDTQTSANGPIVGWRLGPLEKAISAIADYQKFEGFYWQDKKAFFAPLIEEQLQNRITQLIRASMIKASEVPNDEGLISSHQHLETALINKLRTFNIAKNTLLQLDVLLEQLGDNNNSRSLQASVKKFISDRMTEIDNLVKEKAIYTSSGNPQWADQSFAQALFNVQTNKQLQQYVNTERERLSELAYNYAEPLLNYLHNSDTLDDAGASAARWLDTLISLDESRRKIPNNDISQLEDMITGQLADQNNNNCPDYTLVNNDSLGASWFAEKHLRLSRQVWAHCKGASEAMAIDNYKLLANNFTQQLAGLFPFADISAAGKNDLSLASAMAFFNNPQNDPDRVLAQLKALEKRKPDSIGSSWMNFLSQLQAFKTWLQHGAQNDGMSWSTDLNITFHGLPLKATGADQIITWTLATGATFISFPNNGNTIKWQLGQPLTLQLQWASSSAYMPFITNTDTRQVYPNPSNVIYKTLGQWGMLEWLNRYSDNALRQQSGIPNSKQVLTFAVPVSLKTKLPQDRKVAYTSLPNIIVSSQFIDSNGVAKPLLWPLGLPSQAPGINE